MMELCNGELHWIGVDWIGDRDSNGERSEQVRSVQYCSVRSVQQEV